MTSEFTNAEIARLEHRSQVSEAEEARLASIKYLRANLCLDLDYADGLQDSLQSAKAISKWRAWYDANEGGDVRTFQVKLHEARAELHVLLPAAFNVPEPLCPDLQFVSVWPRAPIFTGEGAAIMRVLTAASYPMVAVNVVNDATKEVSREFEVCQFPAGERVESVIRIVFPANGKYTVTAFAAEPDSEIGYPLGDISYDDKQWRFEVEGAPPLKRSLTQILAERQFPPLTCIDTFRVQPQESIIKIPGLTYEFSCRFHGDELTINGREPLGEEKKFVPAKTTLQAGSDGWTTANCRMEFTSDGEWCVIFWVDDKQAAVQRVFAGPRGSLPLSSVEKEALRAPVPSGF
jgi:hypothetical protein